MCEYGEVYTAKKYNEARNYLQESPPCFSEARG